MLNNIEREKQYIIFFEKVSKSKEYKTIQKYFDSGNCASCKMIGHIAYLIRQSNAKTFFEWFNYYKKTLYYYKLTFATTNLQKELRSHNIYYSDKVVEICLKTFIIYKTWIGCQKERDAMEVLSDDNFYCIYPHYSFDIRYAVDFVLVYNKKYRIGIQVKPDTYKETKHDWEKMLKFYRKYKAPVLYIRYNRKTKEFLPADISYIEYRKNIIKNCS